MTLTYLNHLESIAARCRKLLREFSSCAIFPIPTVVLHKRRGKGTVLANLCKPSPGSCRRGTLDPLEIFGCWCCLNMFNNSLMLDCILMIHWCDVLVSAAYWAILTASVCRGRSWQTHLLCQPLQLLRSAALHEPWRCLRCFKTFKSCLGWNHNEHQRTIYIVYIQIP